MPLTSSLAISAFTELSQASGLGTAKVPASVSASAALGSGTGAGKADRVYQARRTLAASGTEDLDLAGVLLDAFGSAITFVRVKGLFIKAPAANTNNVIVGAAASNAWATLLNATGTITLRPGAAIGVLAGTADAVGYAVTASTADLLKVANSGAGSSVSYDICIVGTSA
ncbi:hypothetical protein [Streptomyces acidiscabies]|uniref:PLAT domain-containing protein n=1 Tax=Streptomyces acidiscabies TaxID=42234 RepID=A0ABU4LVU6_9ACTN|nr:hypothetical protein [Streptomyces acidiscabies]MDX3019864.1 hypothetical protein [Streptomyces acidiscabies]